MKGGSVARIRGDRDDVFSHGFLCPKGSTLKQLHEDPDRLRAPMIRRGSPDDPESWEAVSWDDAFAEIEQRLLTVMGEHGRDALALYLGNPNVHNLGGALYNRAVLRAAATKNIYSASTVDQMPKHVSSGLLFGSPDAIPVPDLDRTDHLLMLGANPWESNGSLCTAPDFPGRVKAIQERGGKVVVVDPRRTRTAKEADEHLFIRPGTDAFLLCGLLHVLFAEGLVSLGDVIDHVDAAAVDAVRAAVEPFTAAGVAAVTGIDAATIERLARELAVAASAAVYGRIGTHTVAFGTLASWAVDALNLLTGNLDRPGGAMFPLAAHASKPRPPKPGRGFSTGRHTSRVKGYPEVRSELPVATLADEIETVGEGQVRAVITIAGNPVLSTPDSGRLAAALATLDFMVSVDPYLNETTRFAHVILPPPSPLARSHYDVAFTTLSVRNVANWSEPIVDTDQPQEHEILARLALVLGGQGAGADPAIVDELLLHGALERSQKDRNGSARPAAELVALLEATEPTDRLIEALVRCGPYGDGFGENPDGLNFSSLRDNPHGIDLGPLQPRVPEVLRTTSGTIELAPPAIMEDMRRLVRALEELPAETAEHAADGSPDTTMLLVGRRHVRSNNSWMHNVNVLVKGKERCTLQINPADASRLGLDDGGSAKVASSVGSLVAVVEVTSDVMPGVVSLPHGWGHAQPGTRLSIAAEHAGVNTNVLTDGAVLDPLSGNAVLNAIPVTLAPA
ncbi:MAG: molybdopterin-dependent oxidoreductase [Actinobacteria bacterium]|nr:molybdopterin-dependent oxidoreductase [Actinomycetota bacterium]